LATAGAGWRAEGAPEALRLGGRAVRSREYDLPAGQCTRLVVSAGGALPTVALALRSAAGEALAGASGGGRALGSRCASSAEHVRLEASLDPPSGPEVDAVVARFVRADRAPGAP